MIEYIWMEGPEAAEKLNRILAEQGEMLLNPATTRARVAMEGEKILGFMVIQLIPMIGPTRISNSLLPHSGGVVFKHMLGDVLDFMDEAEARGYVVICENPGIEKICKVLKMEKLEDPVYIAKRIGLRVGL